MMDTNTIATQVHFHEPYLLLLIITAVAILALYRITPLTRDDVLVGLVGGTGLLLFAGLLALLIGGQNPIQPLLLSESASVFDILLTCLGYALLLRTFLAAVFTVFRH